MSEQTAADAVVDAAEETKEEIPFEIKIEEAGPAARKVQIEIPEAVIQSKLEEQYKTLRKEANIPGFRLGHAPQKLIEKRFKDDVREQVRRTLIHDSYEQAVQKHSLQVIGEPQFDNPNEIKLPDTGNLTYSFQVEVQPDITLPPLSGLKVKRAKVEVTDAHVDRAMLSLREQQGVLLPVENRGVQSGDQIAADVHIKVDGQVVGHEHGAKLVAKPGRIHGIRIDDLDARLQGQNVGEKREFTVAIPDTHPDANLRGKQATIEIEIKDIRQLELAEVNQEFLVRLGFANEAELRAALQQQLTQRITSEVEQSMRDQVSNYLLANTQFALPEKLSARQAARLVQRRTLDQLMRGVSRDQVESDIENLRGAAREEAARELKLFFILQKVASEQKVDVDEPELNGRIAMIAAQEGRRPEKLKQEMANDGSLMSLFIQMREQKALDQLLKSAEIVEEKLEDAGA